MNLDFDETGFYHEKTTREKEEKRKFWRDGGRGGNAKFWAPNPFGASFSCFWVPALRKPPFGVQPARATFWGLVSTNLFINVIKIIIINLIEVVIVILINLLL